MSELPTVPESLVAMHREMAERTARMAKLSDESTKVNAEYQFLLEVRAAVRGRRAIPSKPGDTIEDARHRASDVERGIEMARIVSQDLARERKEIEGGMRRAGDSLIAARTAYWQGHADERIGEAWDALQYALAEYLLYRVMSIGGPPNTNSAKLAHDMGVDEHIQRSVGSFSQLQGQLTAALDKTIEAPADEQAA